MKKSFLLVLFLLSIASPVQANEYPKTHRTAYLQDMRQTLSAQDVDPKIMEIMDDYVFSMGNAYCVWKSEPKIFDSYDRLGLIALKRQEDAMQEENHPMKIALYKYFALVHLTHKQSAEKHLCPTIAP